ncbi:response regulator [Candidatus Saccharibacteria bacterium]|nr:response regulator [Candidatus Saccharibacteria bacterium]
MSSPKIPLIYIIEDDDSFARCLASYCSPAQTAIFSNIIDVINHLDSPLPDLIFLDVLLTGPDGFTLLNELVSYPDTAAIPIVIVSSLDLRNRDLSAYGVVACLAKDTLTPKEVLYYVHRYTH